MAKTFYGIGSSLDVPASRHHHNHNNNNNNNIPENAIVDSKRSALYRPWNDILVENRSKWQAKHDRGNETSISCTTCPNKLLSLY